MLWYLGVLLTLTWLSLGGQRVPRDSNKPACTCAFLFTNQPIQSPSPPPPPSLSFHTQGHRSPSQITQRSGPRPLGTVPMPQSPPKLFQLANPKPVYLALSIPSNRIHNKGSCPIFPHSLPPWPALPLAQVVAHVGMPLPFRTVSK